MIPELAHIFKGPFAALGDTLSIEPSPGVTIEKFFTSAQLHETLEIFSQRWAEPDPRVVVTQWSKTYFSTLLPAVLLPALLNNWHLPLAPDTMALKLSPAGAVSGFTLSSEGGCFNVPEKAVGRFDFLVELHLGRIIDMLASTTPLPAKVLWSNAGNVFENVLGRASEMLGEDHPAVQAGMATMAARRGATGRANPLFQPVRYLDESGARVRQRRICCLRYFAPELGYCKSCPKPHRS